MKKTFYLLLVLALFLSNCGKKDESAPIEGRWAYNKLLITGLNLKPEDKEKGERLLNEGLEKIVKPQLQGVEIVFNNDKTLLFKKDATTVGGNYSYEKEILTLSIMVKPEKREAKIPAKIIENGKTLKLIISKKEIDAFLSENKDLNNKIPSEKEQDEDEDAEKDDFALIMEALKDAKIEISFKRV